MNNKIVIVIIVLVIVMLGFVFIDNDEVSPSATNENVNNREAIKNVKEDGAIEYTKSTKPSEKKLHKIVQVKEKKIIVDKRVKYKTSDSSGKYGLEIIDASESGVGNGLSIPLTGIIDGHHFTVEIPEVLKNHDLTLKVTDRKTKEVKEVSLPFISEMKMNSDNPYMQIEFNDIQNFSMHQSGIKKVFP